MLPQLRILKAMKAVYTEKEDVSVCVREDEAERGRRDTEINIQRKRGKEQPPSFSGRLGCRLDVELRRLPV